MAWTYTESGNNTASSSWAVSNPALATGDLIIFNIGWDDSTTTTGLTPPAGPNSETAVVIEDVRVSSNTSVRGKIVYYIATGAWSAGTITFTPSASEQWSAVVIKVPKGEYDTATPIGADNYFESTTTDSSPDLPSLTAGSTDVGGTVVGFMVGDVDDADGTISGWTSRASTDRGAVGVDVWTRNTTATNSESISAATGATYPSARDYVSFIYIVRPQHAPTIALNSPADTATGVSTTAVLDFTGSDTDGDSLEYQVHIDTVNTFDSQGATRSVDATNGNLVTGYNAGPRTVDVSLTIASGASKVVVPVYVWQDVSGVPTVTGAVWNTSETLTKITDHIGTGGTMYVALYYLDNPTSGTHNVSITVTGATDCIKVSAISLFDTATGYDQIGTPSDGYGTTSTVSVTPSADNAIIIDVLQSYGGTTAVQTDTSFYEDTTGSINAASQYYLQSSAASHNMTWSWTTNGDYSHVAVSFLSGGGPLIDALSSADAGFANPDNGGDTHPFNAGENIQYTVQSALSNSTQYFWRVKTGDTGGSNTWSSWSATRSFTTVSSGGTTVKDLIGGFGIIPFAR